MKRITVEAVRQNLDMVLDFVNEELERNDCNMGLQMKIDISLEELFINICSYSYGDSVGEAVVGCEVLEDPRRIVIELQDSGVPFDPVSREEVDTSPEALEGRIGGLGIHMAKNFMDEMKYSYEDSKNILTLIKGF